MTPKYGIQALFKLWKETKLVCRYRRFMVCIFAVECPSVLPETRHQTVLSKAESILRLVYVSNRVLSGLVCSAAVGPVC